MARSDEAAVVIGPIRVWPQGMLATLRTILRDPNAAPLEPLPPELYRQAGRKRPPPELLRFGVAYRNGRRSTNLDAEQSPQIWLHERGAIGGSGGFEKKYWLSPLPASGAVDFVCEWPYYGIAESHRELKAGDLLDAARQAYGPWDA